MIFDTIAAIASGYINQAISIIRISGENAIKIMEQIFDGKVGNNRQITYGWIHNKGEKIDEVLVLWFPGNQNFVGEPTVEINAHGGVLNTNIILELILSTGLARLANPGEFSLRSFLNGKMNLVKAQAINDLIHAQSKSQHSLALKQFQGQTSKYIKNLITDLEFIIGTIEVNIDYPEYDETSKLTSQTVLDGIVKLEEKFITLIKKAENSRLIYNGIKMALVGNVNSGKSSLLNALINENKAIVSDQAGTTRDIVEGSFVLENLLFKISDTAGVRQTNESIEQIGIQKSFEQIQKSDLIIHVIDSQVGFGPSDQEIIDSLTNQVYIQVYNKKDLLVNCEDDKIYISAKNHDIDALLKQIKNSFEFLENSDVGYNTYQFSQINKAQSALLEAKVSLEDYGPDVAIVDLRTCWTELSSIFGRADDEKLLDSIFSNFCLGK
ncbi:tRNA uridine-5-carboxymethylaminomethyl(34) synthesis GTPase MnmE [Mesomycoplasma bovoculi]|uniref:tRNA modification GTPase MnmE n=1 Tax=Mesomycoplasma bovoculi M165/69 TaxID=743966 RepID=W5UU90_9BACT|nr:tRNA uridine-5-carboxymethylaminomethyl(34) synthesis GTPase MnmE [Mesomycoplasma bovoculi]AHH45375.1 tRNA modification GTPase TrmE [Mesomycoplasma bovoculi M165/69]